ncbi:MAG: alpha-L-rhamnosidase C-terminal domain-containing protein [Bacteroidales bacterium]|nr:alpha-L-rhamnosidase C-terminal domain-containing protein [Bacteroidales bacterium]
MKHLLTSILLLAIPTLAIAQQHPLPPTWQGIQHRSDPITRVYLPPQRVMWTNSDTLVTNTSVLLTIKNGQTELGTNNTCAMHTNANDTASILLDYGRELHGGIKLVLGSSSSQAPSWVRIRFGESVGEACSESFSQEWRMGYSTNDHAMRDLTLQIPRDGQIELGNTGFRFVRIDLVEPSRTIHLKEATAILCYRDIPYLGSFRCNDQRLNNIWLTGAYTVHLNMQEYLWDGIKRDRLIWLGDMHPETSTILSVFGGNEVVPRSIDAACQQFPQPHWLNDMSAYSLWYLIIMHQWYMHQGDLDYVRQHRDYIKGVIDHIDSCVEADGTEHLADWRFLDWPSSPNTSGVEAGLRALLLWSLTDAGKLCDLLGEKKHADKCQDIRQRIGKLVKPHNDLKQAAALMAIAGIMTPEQACREVVSVEGAKGFSTFYGYYMLQALAMADRHQQALDIIREFWGAMLDLGATTFWEDFNLDWAHDAARIDEFTPQGKHDVHGEYGDYCYKSYRHSLCHGWASGPTAWLSQHVLGIEVVEPSCKVIRITPHLGDLEWVEGTYPTPQGVVNVRHERKQGKVVTTYTAPKGVRVILQ